MKNNLNYEILINGINFKSFFISNGDKVITPKRDMDLKVIEDGLKNLSEGKESFYYYSQILTEYEENNNFEKVLSMYSKMINNLIEYRNSEDYKELNRQEQYKFLEMCDGVIFGKLIEKITCGNYVNINIDQNIKKIFINTLHISHNIFFDEIVKKVVEKDRLNNGSNIHSPNAKISLKMSLLDNLIRLMHLKIISFIGNERKEIDNNINDLNRNIDLLAGILFRKVKTDENVNYIIANSIMEDSRSYVLKELLTKSHILNSSHYVTGELATQQDYAEILKTLNKNLGKGIDTAYINSINGNSTYIVKICELSLLTDSISKTISRYNENKEKKLINNIKNGLMNYLSNTKLINNIKYENRNSNELVLVISLNKEENLSDIFKEYERIVSEIIVIDDFIERFDDDFEKFSESITAKLFKKEREVLLLNKLIDKDLKVDKIKKKI